MLKYIIEGDIDFYEELYKSMDTTSKEDKEDVKKCLITNEPLQENHITLNCNHKFNYVPLFNDILNHKKKYNIMERKSLATKEIRCPYCRNIQNTLLPYIEDMGVPKIHGVNYYSEDKKNTHNYNLYKDGFVNGTCEYKNIIELNGEIIETGCSVTIVKKFVIDGKNYCPHHKLLMAKKHMMQKKQEAKEKAKLEKQQAKEKAKQEKQEAKEKAKQEKQQAKEKAKLEKQPVDKAPKENVILQQGQCCQLLKTGPKKGSPCLQKVHENNLCLRHFHLTEKK